MESLDELRARLVGEWNNYLKLHSVKFPKSESRLLQLLCLYAFHPDPVSQDQMDDWIRLHGGKNNRQARHLAWDGWYIQTGNSKSTRMEVSSNLANDQLMLVSLELPNPIWLRFNENREEIKKSYPNFEKVISFFDKRGCVMCGCKPINLYPYSKIKKESDGFDIIPLCKECKDWSESRNIKLEVSKKLVARPFIEENIKSQKFNSDNNGSNPTKKAITECGHTIKVTAVKKIGGPMQGQWAILIWGPKVIGKRGKKTLYSSPNINNVKHKLSKFLGNYQIITPESGLSSILPISNSD